MAKFILSCCLITVFFIPDSSALSLPQSSQYQQQRILFVATTKDISAKRFQQAQRNIKQLSDYPLVPYLEYQLLLKNLPSSSLDDINKFINKYSALPLANRLRLKALAKKSKDRQWDDVLALYRDGDSVTYQCANLRAIYHTSNKKIALDQVEQLWLTGNSLPKSCDSLLATWQQAGYRTEQLIWQRIELALISRQGALAKYLAKSLSKQSVRNFNYWYRLYQNPTKLKHSSYWLKQGQFATTMLKVATERLIYQQPTIAQDIWPQITAAQRFETATMAQLTTKLAVALITNQHIDKHDLLSELDWQTLTKSQNSQVLRLLIGQSRWQDIAQHYHQQPQPDLAWQYWYASALEHLNQQSEATEIFQQLASHRRYYGFLASDKLNSPYQFNHQALVIEKTQLLEIESMAAVTRARELLMLDRLIEARREWYHFLKSLDEPQRIAAAQIADNWQWHSRAIITLTMTEHRDDLDIRFPTPHLSTFQQEAKLNKINLSWPLAISRQESAFMVNARSHAGAMGLMQLLPGTAKMQAKLSKVKFRNRSQLLRPEYNIKLGTGYLSQMLEKFNHNIAVAAAAYNAGPHRVKKWLKQDLPQDQWIETIPYRETRQYVKNILAYSVIYQRRLQQKTQLPSTEIKPALMQILR